MAALTTEVVLSVLTGELSVSRESVRIGGTACLGQECEVLRDKVLSFRTTLVSRDTSNLEVQTTILLQSLMPRPKRSSNGQEYLLPKGEGVICLSLGPFS